MRLALQTPADFDRGPLFVETVLRSLHRANPQRLPVTLELGPVGEAVGLIADVPPELKAVFMAQLADACPGLRISVLPENVPASAAFITVRQRVRLVPDVLSLATHRDFEDALDRVRADPLSAVLSALRPSRHGRMRSRVRLTLRPVSRSRQLAARKTARHLQRSFPSLRISDLFCRCCTSDRLSRRLLAKLLLVFSQPAVPATCSSVDTKPQGLLFEAWLALDVTAPADAHATAHQRLSELAGAFGQFASPQATFAVSRVKTYQLVGTPISVRQRGFLLSPSEVATLWHPPAADVQSARLDRAQLTELEPPLHLPDPSNDSGVTELGRIRFRQQHDPVGLTIEDRRRHVFVCGKTGMGKSTLLLSMLCSDIRAGRGVCLIDPHGDLVDAVLSRIPKRRTNDVCVFDAAERLQPVTFNPLAVPPGSDPVLVAESVLSCFEHVFGLSETASPRLLHILRNALLTLVEIPGATLLSINRLLTDDGFRRSAIDRVSNPVVQQFWNDEFARWKPADRTQFIASLQNKLGAFLTNPQLQRVLGDPRGTVNLRRMMDRGRILLVNLSKGRLGESPSRLLGSLLVSNLQTAAMSRADIPEVQRRDFLISIDEFQHFATQSFSSLLSESRKYRVSLTLANQYLDQIDPVTLAAVFGNVGSLLSFQVGPTDAETLAIQFGGRVTPDTLLNLPRYHACTRLLINGQPATPFLLTTLPPLPANVSAHERILRISQSRFSSRSSVERTP